MSLMLNPCYDLYERKGQPFCSSRQVAEAFNKRHDAVLRDIRELDCSETFRLHNFVETSQTVAMPNGGKRRDPISLMTKDGFMFLVMGYRGKKAAVIKETYIANFNAMENFIKDMLTARMEFPAFAEAVMDAHEEPKHYHFSNEADMINRIVLGAPAKTIRERYDLPKGASIRPCLDECQIEAITALQRADIGLLAIVPEFERRKKVLTGLYQRRISRGRCEKCPTERSLPVGSGG